MKLNKKGIGVGPFFAFIVLFFLAILMIVYLTNRYGVLINDSGSDTSEAEKIKYVRYEADIKARAVIYTLSNYPAMANGDVYTFNINVLDLSSNITNSCKGYVVVGKDSEVYYNPYISCGNYKTHGYDPSMVK